MSSKNSLVNSALDSLPPDNLGREAGLAQDTHQAIRLWLRLLTCSTQIEQIIRSNLRTQFGTTLPRFDYLAQLGRPKGLRMKNPVRVPDGDRRQRDRPDRPARGRRLGGAHCRQEDRRSMIVRMTREGKKQFAEMARAHEAWLEQLLDPLGSPKSHELYEQLGHLRQVLAQES